MKKSTVLLLFVLIGWLFAVTGSGQMPGTPNGRRPVPPTPQKPPTDGDQQQQQQQSNAPCPTVAVLVQGPQVVREGQSATFIANIEGGDPKVVPTIVWNTSAGIVTQGQQTRSVQVDTTGTGSIPDRQIKADVWIGGYAPECSVQGSNTIRIIPPAAKFGEFGEVDDKTLKSNLEALAGFLSQTPDNLYLIIYAGRNSERGFTSNWAKRIRDQLVAAGVPVRRIVATDGGFREQPLFDFWTVPAGAEPPRAAPTIDRREIVYPKTTPAKKP